MQDPASQPQVYQRHSRGSNPNYSAPTYGSPNGSTQMYRLPSENPEEPFDSGTQPFDFSLSYPPRTAPRPEPAQRTEFQKFVYSSTGQNLPVYGHNLFENVPSTFAPVDRVPVPADYVIGPGDELLIRAWGQIDLDARVVVDRNGQIYLPRVGSLTTAGLKYEQLNGFLRNAIGRVFKNFDLSVNLGQLRSIQIFVVGQAKHPGTYTVSSLSTLVNALFASGGPDIAGSMRHIQLKRKNQVVSDFDLYDLLLNGDKSKDAQLLPGDVIYIPPVGQLVAIAGSVNMPGIYEIRGNTTIGEEIDLAGGLNTTADGTHAVLERIEHRTTRQVEEFALDPGGFKRQLRDGDVLRVFSVSPRFENAVTLRGNVAQPGRYPWREGMHFCDLIPSRDAIIKRDYWNRQNAMGLMQIGWTNSVADRRTEFQRNAAEVNWDYAVVQRLNHEDLSAHLLPFNLAHAIGDCHSEDNLQLMAGDVITIFSQNDLAVPIGKRTKFVWLEGEVKRPGVYRVEPGETLRDVVMRSGGLTPNAYLFAADFRREATRIAQEKELQKITDDFDKELRTKATQVSRSTSEEQLVAQQQIAAQEAVLQKLRQVEATGRIVLQLKPGENDVSALPALALQDGDRLTIPAKPATVDVMGAVYNQNSFIYQQGKSVTAYLREAGGGTRDADKNRLFVIRADGSVESKQMHSGMFLGSFETMKSEPGDT
ncbi:MAG: SLBB domain-containing protein, partial [Acidobacteria bacterium]|nr:SLBB domain-containing protein [Acidobacteriota bacterium]